MKKFSFLTKSRWVVTIIVLFTLCVNHAWGAVPSGWAEVTSLGGIANGDKIIIVTNNGANYFNGTQSSGHFKVTALSASAPASASAAGVIELVSTGSSNTYKLKLVSTNKYVTASAAKSGNGVVNSSSDASGWTFSYSSGFNAQYQASGKQAYCRSYNNNSFRTYGNTSSGATFKIYKYSSTATHTLSSAVSPAGGGTVALDATSVAEGGTATATATPSSGYVFSSWSISGTGASLSSTSTNPTTVTMGTTDATVTATFALKCATPTFSPEAGTYNNNQSVTITSTAGSTIYYTTDGSTPTTSSAVYSSAISVSSDNTTIKALAVKAGYTNSDVGSATYRLTCATPTFAPVAGTYQTAQSVTLSSTTTSAVIHYTTDGSTPTASSTTASGAITVSADMTIKAIATRTNYGNSEVASATYKIRDCDWFESFDNAAGSGGNDGVWSGSIGTSSFTPDKSGWTFSSDNCGASKCIKLGTSKAAGSATTAALTGMRGTISVKFSAAGFGEDGSSDGNGHFTHDLTISSTSGTPSPSSVTITNQTWDDYEVEITGVTADAQITIASGIGYRFFLDEVCIKNSGVQYSVTYDDNDATSGSVPTDGNKYDRNGSATVLGNPNNLAKTGWTFAGWNTAADGSGTTYAAGSTYSNITSNVTLYAKWTCTVTWSVNENTSACSPETVTYDPDGCKVTTVPRPDPEDYCGDKFVGWYTTDYDDDDTAPTGTFKNVDDSPNITGDRTFYAVFADFVAE